METLLSHPEILLISLAVVTGFFIGALIQVIRQRSAINHHEETITGLKSDLGIANNVSAHNKKCATASEIQVSQLTRLLNAAETKITELKTQIAELTSKVQVVNKVNNKLLKEVSDDVTVNVHNEDPSLLVVEKPKRRNYKRRSSNGRPTTGKRPSKKG